MNLAKRCKWVTIGNFLRASARALPEMRAVAGEVLKIMKQEAPKVFGDL